MSIINKCISNYPACLAVAVLLLLLLLAGPASISAHPHVFLETEMQVELDEHGIKGVWQEWTFDEYQSAWIINQYNLDKTGSISDSELERLYNETFKNLKHHDFFTWILVDGEKIPATEITDFSVTVQDDLAIYSFFVPFELEINSDNLEVFILVYDESYFCHVFFPPEEIGFKGNTSSWVIDYTTQKKSNLTFYFGMITPEALKITLKPL